MLSVFIDLIANDLKGRPDQIIAQTETIYESALSKL